MTVIDGDDITVITDLTNNASTQKFTIDKDDSTVLYIDSDKKAGDAGGELQIADYEKTSDITTYQSKNVWYMMGKDGNVELLVVDSKNNEWKGADPAPIAATEYTYGVLASANSSNVNVVIRDKAKNEYLTVDQINALGITQDMIRVVVNNRDVALEKSASVTDQADNKNYPWNNTAICVVDAATFWPELNTALGTSDAGFLKIHTGATFAKGNMVSVFIRNTQTSTFAATSNTDDPYFVQ